MTHESNPRGGEFFESEPINEQSLVRQDRYQALFFSSGQVYFGKLLVYPNLFILSDIYYLQTPEKEDGTKETSLVKLGNELHAPEDAMFIRPHQVNFWENLKDDSQVANAIRNFQEDQGQL